MYGMDGYKAIFQEFPTELRSVHCYFLPQCSQGCIWFPKLQRVPLVQVAT